MSGTTESMLSTGEMNSDEVSTPATYVDINELPWYLVFKSLCATFQGEGQEIRVVGGAVRDIILNIQPKDIDLCTTAPPATMLEILNKHNIILRETGIQHGTVTVIKKGFHFEMTSLRVDYMDKGERVCKYGTNFKEDAKRRDLTINAMSLDVEGRVHDYFQGQQHLEQGALRFTDSALKRVSEDPLRILRYFRFASCSDLFPVKCPEDYKEIFYQKRSALADPSIVKGERIWKEIGKTLSSPKCCDALDQMKECKILRSMGFPVLEKSFKCLIDPTYTVEGLIPDTKAAVILGIIFKGKTDMLEDLVSRWRVSNRVRDVSRIAAELSDNGDIADLKRHLYSLNPAIFKEEKSVRIQALRSDKLCWLSAEQVEDLELFERPTFPFNKDHFAKVPKFKSKQKDATDWIKEKWVESCFTMEIPEMIEMVRKIADDPEILRERLHRV